MAYMGWSLKAIADRFREGIYSKAEADVELDKKLDVAGGSMTGTLYMEQRDVVLRTRTSDQSSILYLSNTTAKTIAVLRGKDDASQFEIQLRDVETGLITIAQLVIAQDGNVSLSGENVTVPTSVSHLTRKDYVDGEVAKKLDVAGDTMLGTLYMEQNDIALRTRADNQSSINYISKTTGKTVSVLRGKDDASQFEIQLRDVETGLITTAQLTLTQDGNVSLSGGNVTVPTADAHLTRKDYVDGEVAKNTIESGEEASGTWTKFPDGTLIQRGSHVTVDTGGNTLTYPVPFVDTKISITANTNDSTTATGITVKLSLVNFDDANVKAVFWDGSAWVLTALSVGWIAVGKWK